ncbi:Protein CPR-5 [Raphanus sativus]|uniref:Protein CPR-5 n=1 Tax=Raphanus sativus TaxID=3726 RepID=A0A6J0JD30_RAPSA|nr:protein CPR-5 [Raphanus sativus]KAJ4897233.1 Protein CPR-5 [Raphanus sativus]
MDALLLPPSPDPQKSITDPANHHPENLNSIEELKDETMRKKMKPSPLEKRKLKAKKKKQSDEAASSSTSCCSSSSSSAASNLNSTRRVSRVAHRLRNPPVRLGITRRTVGERQAEALALPLGMSFAAFANLVLQRKSANGQNVYVDDLAGISASAVKESLANVYGDKLGSFATNFEKSFNSTLKILKLINESASSPHQLDSNNNVASCDLDRSTTDGCSDSDLSAKETSSATSAAYEAIQGSSMMNEIVLHEEPRRRQQLSRDVSRSSSAMPLTTFEKALEEQARANDLKSMEIGLTMRKLRLKETELALSYESNNLGKSKLEMNASKAAFRAEKFKTEQEDSRKADTVNKIMDWLVLSVFTMLATMLYGAYIFSQQRIMEAASICEPSEEKTSSWWVPKQVSSFNAEFNILLCRVRVWVQSFFGVLMILVITYFIIQRSSGTTAKQTMPVTFIVIFLGIVCGLPGKFCVDTLGGDGKLWLLLWEAFCVLQFVANVFTLAFYRLMYGPVGGRCDNTMVPYWARRSVFFVVVVLALPVMNGLLPFATYGEWREHWATWWAGPGSED